MHFPGAGSLGLACHHRARLFGGRSYRRTKGQRRQHTLPRPKAVSFARADENRQSRKPAPTRKLVNQKRGAQSPAEGRREIIPFQYTAHA